MNTAKTKRAAKLSPMKTMRLAEASKKLEGIRFEETRELTSAEKAMWEQARRGPGRPRKAPGEKAARVLVTIAPDLLAQADAYAQRHDISRAELFARGLVTILARDGSNRKTG
jgi:hypothetical protein